MPTLENNATKPETIAKDGNVAEIARRLAVMNLALRGIEADFGPEHADTFRRDLHPDLRADTATRGSAKPKPRSHLAGLLRGERQLLANPPFNDSDWFRKDDDVRWQFGVPPKGNANFAWVQHFIHHLAPGGAGTAGGMAGFVLANGSMSSNQSGEGDIRRALIEADLVDCMVALPGQFFGKFGMIESVSYRPKSSVTQRRMSSGNRPQQFPGPRAKAQRGSKNHRLDARNCFSQTHSSC